MSQAAYDTAALALSGLQHYWKLTEASGTTAADSQGSTTLTYGADVSGFLTTGPDGAANVPVNNGSTNRVAINSTGFAPPATATYFWWQRQDVDATGDEMAFELANSPTFSHLAQLDYGNSTTSQAGGNANKAVAVMAYGSAANAAYWTKGTISTWYFYCLVIDPSLSAANQVKVYRDGVLVSTNGVANSLNGQTPATMKVGVLGRNNNGTRQLPIKAAMCGFGLTNTVLSTGTMTSLHDAMLGITAVGQATETDSAGTVGPQFGGKVPLERATGNSNYNAFPGFVRAPDGTLVAAYVHSDGHTSNNGTIRVRRFDSNGVTSDVQDIRTVAGGADPAISDVSCFYSSATEIAVLWNECSTPGLVTINTVEAHKIAFSTDSGATWSAATNIASSMPFQTNGVGVAGQFGITPCPAIRIPAGTVLKDGSTVATTFHLLAQYGYDDKTHAGDAGTTLGYVKVAKSTDACRTWSTLSTSVPKTTDKDYTETALLLLDNGQILSLTRSDVYNSGFSSGHVVYLTETRSDDGGATWTAPTRVLGSGVTAATGYGGRPDLCQLSNGTVYLHCRDVNTDGSSSYPSFRTSTDRGVTWSSGRDPWDLAAERFGVISSAEAPRGKDVYGAPIENVNALAFVWAEENEEFSSSASLYYRVLARSSSLGQATETDTAGAITSFRASGVGQATETDTAQPITAVKVSTARATVALATSSSTALALATSSSTSLAISDSL